MCWSYRALLKYCELLEIVEQKWLVAQKNLCYTCTYLIHFNPDMSPLSCLWFARDFHLKRALSARTTFSCVFCISDLSALFLRSSWCCFGFLAALFFYFCWDVKKIDTITSVRTIFQCNSVWGLQHYYPNKAILFYSTVMVPLHLGQT